ncbi:non-canonical purine NTP pyrophosphatase [Bifidobacterium gallicum]|uniref:dITP/XTP pyrophosphatase n=1 Tax=Bifidobacterium gallicum DSM 20093 = LMG 11596 TaxID=561180 RepID=D1NUD1_9BIFI|nr:non-canonical purine NTP pyrophosphatase [Bifidobacterium gallicum]EFA23335.1 non-canonical purine NTP pyrophosphatase, RdgB/HAM1 family [Bifidobacterium gallicum DSM 20093 = LMG 11596]KFI57902.1 nucleoside-triphosphate diphosphatase [Bifidobacterium gallicum DSM 20093 = LMG 11596]
MRIIVATHNEGKLQEINRILTQELAKTGSAASFELVSAGSLGLPDPKEDGVSFEQNALIKARAVAAQTGSPAIADDSGLIVDVMGSAPGILSARWAGKHGDDVANYELLLAQLEDIPDHNRQARFVCAAALAVPESKPQDDGSFAIADEKTVLGEMKGMLIRAPRGEHGFGYDPIFVPDDQPARDEDSLKHLEPLTSAQMTATQKNAISHRGKALRTLATAVVPLIA